MRFKRLAAAVMAATMCGSLLVGCGGNDNKSADNNENITATIKVWGPAEDQAEENGKWQMASDNVRAVQFRTS